MRKIRNSLYGGRKMQRGQFYLRGEKNRALPRWVWCLGDGFIGGDNYKLRAPTDTFAPIDWTRTISSYRQTPPGQYPPLTDGMVHQVAYPDYSPWSFAVEAQAHGFSRPISREAAEVAAVALPMLVGFTHKAVPLVDSFYLSDLLHWAEIPDDAMPRLWFSPSPTRKGWDWSRVHRRRLFSDHWLVSILMAMDTYSNGEQVHLTKIMPVELVENVLTAEQLFGMAWATRIIYTVRDESESELQELMQMGIEPVELS